MRANLENLARQLTFRAPHVYEQALALLREHRQRWELLAEDMRQLANSNLSPDICASTGQQSIRQILASGEQVRDEIAGLIARSILTGEGKPIGPHEWTKEQRVEGMEKLRAIRSNGHVASQDRLWHVFNSE